ncbi:hypothetical protein [Mycobacterium talmoniae]|uniref:Serine/threonine protein kinase n=1 Tax=Mycobacterium talmoniae TaxID=1858794 RepID=A0A1S1NEC2_9MYCO|nr:MULTISPECIES: hypothetical protein [Mycobacterium]OHU98599.1 hypothetical protein BKN37_20385 [Mycobacterium talmoniae]TDH49567.1 hypothetical protein E2F47_20360 [Mycobacterium eburneum]
MVFLEVSTRRVAVAAAACAALLAVGVPTAAAAPDTDDQGFVDSTARCAPPDVAVAFGRTESSRVAICKTPDGGLEYRGVRVRDGAKLIAPASQSGGVSYIADQDGITYTVTRDSLVVSEGGDVLRREPMVEFHEPGAPAAPAPAPPSPPAEPTPTPTEPLPPPLPAEVGG